MKTRFQQFVKQLFVVMAVLLLTLASLSAVAQVNMNRQIVIHTNTTSALPRLVLAADTTNTPVKIVCGTWDTILYLDSISSRHFDPYIARCYYERFDSVNLFDTIMIYGDVSFFSTRLHWNVCRKFDFTANELLRVVMCDSNRYLDSVILGYQPRLEILTFGTTSLAGIDVSGCPSLKMVRSHETHFSAQAYDELMCQLPQWRPADSAKFFISDYNGYNIDTSFSSSNSQIALSKNWTFYDRYSGPTTVQTTGTYLCPPPVRRIRLKVRSDSIINLNFVADSANSPIRVVSGTTDTTFRIGTSIIWQNYSVFAEGSYMDIYGNLKEFYCPNNHNNVVSVDISQNPYLKRLECGNNAVSYINLGGVNNLEILYAPWCSLTSIDLRACPRLRHFNIRNNRISTLDISRNPMLETFSCQNNRLTSLDVSHNPLLTGMDCSNNQIPTLDISTNLGIRIIRCYGNPISASVLDDMICTLPNGSGGFLSYYIMSINDRNDSNDATYAANVRNAYDKGWSVCDTFYFPVNTSNGTFLCPPTTTRKIRVKVLPDNDISINFAADTSNTPIRVLCGSLDTVFIADTVFTMRSIRVHADAVTMDIYGDVKSFYCSGNQNKVWSLDVSQNPYLKKLNCSYNAISPSIPFAENIMIEELDMSHNNITAQSLRRCPNLTYFNCSYNNISSINILSAPVLETFYCDNNSIAALDISNNPLLSDFDCSNNRLSSLDFSANTVIEHVRCYGNSLSARALDEMMCSLPTVSSGILVPMGDVTDSNDAFYDANVRNAIAKHWSVFDSNNYQVHSTNGTYVCGQGIETAENSRLTITPNPAKGSVTVGGMEGFTEVRIIDLQGRTVKRQRATAGNAVIDIRELESGIYFLKTEYSCDKLIVK